MTPQSIPGYSFKEAEIWPQDLQLINICKTQAHQEPAAAAVCACRVHLSPLYVLLLPLRMLLHPGALSSCSTLPCVLQQEYYLKDMASWLTLPWEDTQETRLDLARKFTVVGQGLAFST